MSAKHPTLGQALQTLGYYGGARELSNPRIMRYVMRQTGPTWRRVQALIRKRVRRRAAR